MLSHLCLQEYHKKINRLLKIEYFLCSLHEDLVAIIVKKQNKIKQTLSKPVCTPRRATDVFLVLISSNNDF